MSKKTTKRALAMSFVSVFLCVCMLVGTTFAWFTDSVTSSNNIIKSGTLDVTMEWKDATANGAQQTYKDASTGAIFDYAKWEPGYVAAKNVKISNEGTLALKYKLNIVPSVTPAAGEANLADVIEVYFANGAVTSDRNLTGLTKVGTLSALMADADGAAYGDLLAGLSTEVTIALKMQETADNKYQDLSVGDGFKVQLLATQLTYEKDSFNNQYDANAKYDVDIWDGKTVTAPVADADGVYHITTAAELVGMMSETGNSIYIGKTIVLDNNIDLGGRTVKGIGGMNTNFAGVFDGQGYTISNFKIESDSDYYAGLFNQVSHGGTIKNLTVKNATIVGKSMVGAIASSVDSGATIDNCKAIDCTLIGVKKVGAVVGYSAGSTVTNNYAENCAVYYSEKEGAEILGYEYTGSTVNNNTFTDVKVVNATVILDADDLVYFAKSVNVDGETYAGKTVKLIADIDLANRNWLPIGMIGHLIGGNSWYYAPFCGTFDGDGHSISNMKTCDMWNAGDYQYFNGAALFGCTGDGAVIKNLTVKNAVIWGTAGNGGAGYSYSAAVVGNHWQGSLTFDKVSVEDTGIYSGRHVGCLLGIAGRESTNPATVTFTDCSMKNITEVYVNSNDSRSNVIGTDGHFNPTIIGEESVVQENVTVNKDREEFYRIKTEYFPDLT